MRRPADLGLDLLAIAQRAQTVTLEPWLHEEELDPVLDALDPLQAEVAELDQTDADTMAMVILIRSVRLLIGAAQLELSPAGDASSRMWTESKRAESNARAVRSSIW